MGSASSNNKPNQNNNQQIKPDKTNELKNSVDQRSLDKKNSIINQKTNQSKLSSFDWDILRSLDSQSDHQDDFQYILKQFYCTIKSHYQNQIEGICVNKNCKAVNRKFCTKCILDMIHHHDENFEIKKDLLQGIKVDNIIQEYKKFASEQLTYLKFPFYYEKLQLICLEDKTLFPLLQKDLDYIQLQLSHSEQELNLISIQQYIVEQHKTNLGLSEHLEQNFLNLNNIESLLDNYQKKAIHLKQQIQNKQILNTQQAEADNHDQTQSKNQKDRIQILTQLIDNQLYRDNLIDQSQQTEIKNQINTIYQKEMKSTNQYTEQTFQVLKLLNGLNQKDYKDQYHIGCLLSKLNKDDQAIEQYDITIYQNSQFFRAYYKKGISLDKLQKYPQAIEMYNHSIKYSPFNSQIYLNKGLTLIKQKKYLVALQIFQQALELNPFDTGLLDVDLEINSDGEIVNSYLFKPDELQKQFQSLLVLLLNMGFSYYKLQKYEDALIMYDRVISYNPKQLEVYLNKGLTLNKKGEYKEAIEMFEQALLLNPKYCEAFYGKGCSFHFLQQYEKAISNFDIAIGLNPQNYKLYLNKGITLNKFQKYDEALEMMNIAQQLNPFAQKIYLNKGIVLSNQEQFEEAAKMYERVINFNPECHLAYFNLGYAFINTQKFELAIEMYDMAIKIDKINYQSYFNKGIAQEKLQQFDQAKESFLKVIELNPQYSDAYINLGQTFESLECYDQALEMYDKAIQLNPYITKPMLKKVITILLVDSLAKFLNLENDKQSKVKKIQK